MDRAAKLTALAGTFDDRFGSAVSIDGDRAVIGAPFQDMATGQDAGSAYVFVRSGTIWSQQQQLVSSDQAADDRSGSSVSISGTTALIGVPYDDILAVSDAGSGDAFVWSGTTWNEDPKLIALDSPACSFGSSTALSGDTLLVGAPDDSTGGGPKRAQPTSSSGRDRVDPSAEALRLRRHHLRLLRVRFAFGGHGRGGCSRLQHGNRAERGCRLRLHQDGHVMDPPAADSSWPTAEGTIARRCRVDNRGRAGGGRAWTRFGIRLYKDERRMDTAADTRPGGRCGGQLLRLLIVRLWGLTDDRSAHRRNALDGSRLRLRALGRSLEPTTEADGVGRWDQLPIRPLGIRLRRRGAGRRPFALSTVGSAYVLPGLERSGPKHRSS